MSLGAILNTGRNALFAFQKSIEVTGNNVANVNTPGYSRQEALLVESRNAAILPGLTGGVEVDRVMRHFDQFVENGYNDAATLRERWTTLADQLSSVEGFFNESSMEGLGAALNTFFQDWQALAQRPGDPTARESLRIDSASLLSTLRQAAKTLESAQQNAEAAINQEVESVNDMLGKIAKLNKEILLTESGGAQTANPLRDERSRLVRSLSESMDINYQETALGCIITTKAGHTLVDGANPFRVAFEPSRTEKALVGGSTYAGDIHYEGSDEYEYHFQALGTGAVGTAQFRVSIDGGKTWLTDENGAELHVSPGDAGSKIQVKELTVWFDAGTVAKGDAFTIVPKKGLYWYKNASTAENITPQMSFNGSDDASRMVGGKLAGLFNLRDNYAGKYQDKLDALTESLVWEVNRIHSQGAGLTPLVQAQGSYSTRRTDVPLGSSASGLAFGDKLQAGGLAIHVYNRNTGGWVETKSLNFATPPANAGFDPKTNDLDDVIAAMNGALGAHGTVTLGVNNSVTVNAADGFAFQFGADSTGLLAALGLNTFFTGRAPEDVGVSSAIAGDLGRINAGRVNGGGEANVGDNATAQALAGLQRKTVTIRTFQEGKSELSMIDYYNNFLAGVGADVNYVKFNSQYQTALANDLNARQEEISGVNLDEELSNIIKFQHSYQAAAKLISTTDQMFQSLLSIKN